MIDYEIRRIDSKMAKEYIKKIIIRTVVIMHHLRVMDYSI